MPRGASRHAASARDPRRRGARRPEASGRSRSPCRLTPAPPTPMRRRAPPSPSPASLKCAPYPSPCVRTTRAADKIHMCPQRRRRRRSGGASRSPAAVTGCPPRPSASPSARGSCGRCSSASGATVTRRRRCRRSWRRPAYRATPSTSSSRTRPTASSRSATRRAQELLGELLELAGEPDWIEAMREGTRRYLRWWQERPLISSAYLLSLPTVGARALRQRERHYAAFRADVRRPRAPRASRAARARSAQRPGPAHARRGDHGDRRRRGARRTDGRG